MNTHANSNSIEPNFKEDLVFAERLLQGVAEAMRSLLTIRNHEESIQSSIAILGEATQVDRVYVFRHHVDDVTQSPLVSQKWEWVQAGVSTQIDNPDLQNVPLTKIYPRWYQNFSKGLAISGMVASFPIEEQTLLVEQNILSIVVVPILIDDDFWGFMGFDDCQHGHDWTPSEVAALKAIAHSFGGAITRYQAQENLQKANDRLTLQTSELIEAKDKANQASHAKSIFLANMSHELRTPLNGILGYTQILKRGISADSNHYRGVQVIHQCATHLLSLINDVLDFSKIDAEHLVITPVSTEFNALLDEVANIFRVQATEKQLAFNCEFSANLPLKVSIDARHLRQVLLNLLSNALKFTEAGQVTFSVISEKMISKIASDPDSTLNNVALVRFAVIDTGVGIAPDDVTRIFNAFEQVGDFSRKADGTGLGLNISQQIVSAMGGDIQVESRLNAGSIFSFSLELPVIEAQSTLIDVTSDVLIAPVSLPYPDSLEQQQSQSYVGVSEESLPTIETLMHCWKLVQAGRLKKLIEYVESAVDCEPKHAQYLQKISDLAMTYEVDALETMLSEHIKVAG